VARYAIMGRIANQINLLRYFGKYRKRRTPDCYDRLLASITGMNDLAKELLAVQGRCIDEVRGLLLSIEGRAGSFYWEGVKALLDGKIDFAGRQGRGATDPVNACLNYGYGILYSTAWGALTTAGLEPFAGFLHVDRPGKPSLVLDFVEEFRATVVDRAVIALLGKGTVPEMDGDRLDEASRRTLAERVLARLEAEEHYEDKKYRLKTIITRQARHLATFLRREGPYQPFVGGW